MKIKSPATRILMAAMLLSVFALVGSSTGSASADTAFPQTGQKIWGPFETYWKAHGGLAQFGMPRTSVFPARRPPRHPATEGATRGVAASRQRLRGMAAVRWPRAPGVRTW